MHSSWYCIYDHLSWIQCSNLIGLKLDVGGTGPNYWQEHVVVEKSNLGQFVWLGSITQWPVWLSVDMWAVCNSLLSKTVIGNEAECSLFNLKPQWLLIDATNLLLVPYWSGYVMALASTKNHVTIYFLSVSSWESNICLLYCIHGKRLAFYH